MSVSISSAVYWADWPNATDTVFDLRAKSNRDWISAEGEIIPAGVTRVVGTGTIVARRPTLPAIVLPTTSSGLDDQTARWTITMHRTGQAQPVVTVLDDFPLPVSFEPSATWAQIKIHKNGKQPLRDTSVYTKTETDYQISLAAGALNKANASPAYGRTALSVAPASAADPIAVGVNDYASVSRIALTRLSLAPASASVPIAVGDNDPRVGMYINVESYGASVSASDNSAAVIAALAAAQSLGIPVFFPRLYDVQSSILCTALGNSGTETYVSLIGRNPVQSGLKWTGATNGRLLDITFNKFFEVSGMGFYNGVAKGTTMGVHLTGPNTSGTQTLGGVFERVLISGFDIGMLAGAYTGHATSEILYKQIYFQSNNTGWKNQDLNTLDHVFMMLLMSGNGIGLDVNSGNVAVYGGSASGQTVADFATSNAGSPFSVRDFRSETANRFLTTAASSTQHTITIQNCLVQAITNVDNIAITTTGNTQLQIEASTIAAKVRIGLDLGTSLIMRNNFVIGDTAGTVPFFVDSSSAANLGPKYIVEGNRFYTDSSWYPDESGQYILTTRVPVSKIRKGDTTSPPYAELNRVKMLAYGSSVAGKNLRLQETFATSATKNVTFIRNITVSTTNGSSQVGNTSGQITPADIGKKIVLVAADGAGGNVTAYIESISSPTAFNIRGVSALGIGITSGAITATIGEDEPDANYMLMLGCSAQETVSWSSKATTGFTLTSDNATSTATVDIMLVR